MGNFELGSFTWPLGRNHFPTTLRTWLSSCCHLGELTVLQQNTMRVLKVWDSFCWGFELTLLSCVTLPMKPQKRILRMGRENSKHRTSQRVAQRVNHEYEASCNATYVVPCCTLGVPEWDHNLATPLTPLASPFTKPLGK